MLELEEDGTPTERAQIALQQARRQPAIRDGDAAEGEPQVEIAERDEAEAHGRSDGEAEMGIDVAAFSFAVRAPSAFGAEDETPGHGGACKDEGAGEGDPFHSTLDTALFTDSSLRRRTVTVLS